MKTLTTILPEHLTEWDACYAGDELAAACAALPATPLEIARMEQFPAGDRLWLLLREEIIPAATLHLLACSFAEAVLPIFESAYPADPRPRDAIDTARARLRGEATDAELITAVEAARDASAAAWGADAWADSAAARGAAWAASAAVASAAVASAAPAELIAGRAAAWVAWAAGAAAENDQLALVTAVLEAQQTEDAR